MANERERRRLRSGAPTTRDEAVLSIRVDLPTGARLGPGKIELMERIRATGSISAAARAMGLSYTKAWLMIDDLNKLMKTAVIATATGGERGGKAELTSLGKQLVSTYRDIEAKSAASVRAELDALSALNSAPATED